jgi:hypothetical protein
MCAMPPLALESDRLSRMAQGRPPATISRGPDRRRCDRLK